jgi:ATP-binding cassette, subfamily B, bacterial
MKKPNMPINSLSDVIIQLIKPYKGLFSVMALTVVLWALINTFTPYTLKLIIDHVVSFQGNKSELFTTIQRYVWIYIFFWIGLTADMRILDWVKLKLFPRLREDVMTKMFAYLNQHSHHYFQNNFAGSLVNKILDMQTSIVGIFTMLDDVFGQTIGLSVAVIVLLLIHPVFAAILMGWAATFIAITFIFLKPIQNLSFIFAESKTTVVGRMVDSISNIINVRLFARHFDENRYIHQSVSDAVQKDRAMQAKIIKMRMCWDASIILLVSFNLFLLLNMYSKNQVTIGDFTFVISLSVSILWNLWFLAGQFVFFSEQIGICKQALSILSVPHEIVDILNAKPLIISKGKIQFDNVSFHYDKGQRLFKNKNIVIPGGQKVGLVGFTGSGKSTFVNLILRLFEVESGDITIDDQNIRQVMQQSLREQIALIPQDISLFHRSLMENIRFGDMNASDEDVIEIAKKAHCHEFISQLAVGYQSLVGERGIKLSGGQRQRIAIARAMLKNAPILILDEATSSLDSITEKYIQDAFNVLMQDKTTIVIAHRLSTLAKMDRILVFDNGVIIEDGTHDELLAKNNHYAKMWHIQAGGFLPEKDKNESS